VRRGVLPYLLALTVGAGPFQWPSSPALATQRAYEDCLTIPAAEAPNYRYLWTNRQGQQLADFRAAFKLHCNLLSRDSTTVDITEVAPWLWRLDLREPGWDAVVWEQTCRIDPFFHLRITLDRSLTIGQYWPGGKDPRAGGKFFKAGRYALERKKGQKVDLAAPWLPVSAINGLRARLLTEAPILSADWLFVQSARQISLNNDARTGVGYYDFLGIKDRDSFFRLIKLRIRDSREFGREMKAAVVRSGVSPLGRQIVRFQGLGGAAWVTHDPESERDNSPIRQLRSGSFRHAAEEWVATLPNGLEVTPLFNAQGVLQNNAPADQLGFADTSVRNRGNDGRIHPNLSCRNCHNRASGVLQPIDDFVRKTPLRGFTKKAEEIAFRREWLADLTGQLAEDNRLYVRAYARATQTRDFPQGLTPALAADRYAAAFHGYATAPVTLEVAGRDLGISGVELLRVLRERARDTARPYKQTLGFADFDLVAFFTTPPEALSRTVWESAYPLAAAYRYGLPLSALEVRK
jgi:hypothetical protein